MSAQYYLKLTCLLSCLSFQFVLGARFNRYDSGQKMLWISEFQDPTITSRQPVCIYDQKKLVGCGFVDGVNGGILGVTLSRIDLLPLPDASVTVVIANTNRKVSSTLAPSEAKSILDPKTFSIAAGMTAGTNYFYPTLHLQLALSNDFSIGLQPMLASYKHADNSITGYGGYLTGTYYYTHPAFRGVMFEAGIGYFNVTAKAGSVEEKHSTLGGKLTAGWRGKALWDLGLDLGVEGGLQYIGFKENNLEISFHGLLPLLAAYIGYSF